MNARRLLVVIGSINMDLVCRTDRIPAPGETILGSDLMTIPGGKGANQAVAAAKLDAEVHMVGRVRDNTDRTPNQLMDIKRFNGGNFSTASDADTNLWQWVPIT